MKVVSNNQQIFASLPNDLTKQLSLSISEDLKIDVNSYFDAVVLHNISNLDVILLMLEQRFKSVINYNPDFFKDDLVAIVKIQADPEYYFKEHAVSVIPNVKSRYSVEFNSSSEKAEVKEKCQKFIEPFSNANVTESFDAIFEELFMNAIYDAVRESKSKTKESHPYLLGKKAKFTICASDNLLAISCSDPYGSLIGHKFFSRLFEIMSLEDSRKVRMDQSQGAGLGCSIMFEHSLSIFIGVESGVQTIVTCIIPLGMSYRQRAKLQKSLHLFEIKPHNGN